MLLYSDVIKVGNKLLREKSIDALVDAESRDLLILKEMNDYLYNGYDKDFCRENDIRSGVGIAAPQVGVLKKMLCILAFDEQGDLHNYCMMNPKIISHSEELTYLEAGEGCLSVLEEYKGYIHRYKRIKVRTFLYHFKTNTISEETIQLKGYLAVIFQHEYDHLNGILFFDRINKDNPYYVPVNSTPVKFNEE